MMDTIFTPVFNGTIYQHHLCKNCGYKLKVGQSVFGGVSFYDVSDIKFCPKCGESVIRFSQNPIYETKIDFEPLYIFYEEYNRFERKLSWLFYCNLSSDKQKQINTLMPFAKSETGWTKIAYDMVKIATNYGIDWRKQKRLIKEFGGAE